MLPNTSKQITKAPVQMTKEVYINMEEFKSEYHEKIKSLDHNRLYNFHITNMRKIADNFGLMLNINVFTLR